MSGSDNVNVTWTADTSSFDAALSGSASAAQAAFTNVSASANNASNVASASLKQMEASLRSAQAQMSQMGPVAAAAFQGYIATLQSEIEASKAAAAAAAEHAASLKEVVAAAEPTTLQGLINSAMGLDRNLSSARDSAKAFTAALATQGVTETELAAQQEALRLSQASLGAQVQSLSGPAFFGRFEQQFPGLRSQLLSAADSGKVFEREMQAIGGSITGLTSKEFVALINANTGVSSSAKSAAASARAFQEALREEGQGAGQAATLTAGATRELIVLGREAMTGNLSRMPGSFMVLASRIGNVTTAFMGMAAGIGVAAFAAVELFNHFRELQAAQRSMQAAGAFFNSQMISPEFFEQLNKVRDKLNELPDITRKEASEVVSEFARMPGLTAPFLDAITNNIQVFADALGVKAPDAAKALANAFGEPSTRGREFLMTINASVAQLNAFDQAQDAAGRRAVMLAAYEDKLTQATKAPGIAAAQTTQDLIKLTLQMGAGGEGATNFAVAAQQLNQIKTDRSIAAVDALKAAILSLNNVEKVGGSGGMASWSAKHHEALTEIETQVAASAKTRKSLEEATARASIDFWSKAAKENGITDAQRTEALASANRARLSLMKDEVSGAASAAHQGLMAQIAAISAQQASVKNDFNQWKSLQDQKLSIIRGAVGEQTALYQNALKELNAMELQHATQASNAALQSIKNQEQLDRTALSTKKEVLDAELAAHLVTKSQELNELKTLVTQQDNANIESLNNLIKTLQQGTNEYAHAMAMRSQLTAQLVRDVAKYNSEILQADAKAATSSAKAWATAADKIGDSFETEAGRYISGQQTMAQAAQNTVTSIVQATVTGAIKMAAQWATSQLAMTTASVATQNAVNASQAAGGTGFFALMAGMVARWTGKEAAQTAATATGTAARSTANAAEAGVENASFLVRAARWIASELGMTASTTTSAATRTAVTSSAGIAAQAESKALAVGEISAAAGVAAANAFAATAAIPYVGPALAPAAGATAFAAVQSYQAAVALDVGAYNVPSNMPANLHAGEMVIPATFAAGLRNAVGATGTGAGASAPISLAYSPTLNVGGDNNGGGLSYGQLSGVLAASQKQLMDYVWNMFRNGNLMLPLRGING